YPSRDASSTSPLSLPDALPILTRAYVTLAGAPPLPTMGAEAHWLRPGERARAGRSTASRVFHVIEGRGQSRVGETELTWEPGDRSEEHTSELQSRFDLVCRLLL